MEITIKISDKELIETLLSYYKHDNVELSSPQLEILNNITEEKLLIRKDRQTGTSLLINAIIACKLVSNEKNEINIFSPYENSSRYDLNTINSLLDILITGLELKLYFIKRNKNSIELSNGNYINLIKSTENKYSIKNQITSTSWCIFDEVAFNKNAHEMYLALIDKSKNIKITFISTQNGIDKIIFPIYVLRGKTNFKVIDVSVKNTKFFRNSIERLKEMLPEIQYLEAYSGKFIIKDPKNVDMEEMIINLNSFITDGKKLSLLDLNNILKDLKYVSDY